LRAELAVGAAARLDVSFGGEPSLIIGQGRRERGSNPALHHHTNTRKEADMIAKKNAVVSNSIAPAGPQPLADEDLGTVAGGHGHKKHKRTTGYRRTTRRSRDSYCGRDSRYTR
jgi:hypothetical protein